MFSNKSDVYLFSFQCSVSARLPDCLSIIPNIAAFVKYFLNFIQNLFLNRVFSPSALHNFILINFSIISLTLFIAQIQQKEKHLLL